MLDEAALSGNVLVAAIALVYYSSQRRYEEEEVVAFAMFFRRAGISAPRQAFSPRSAVGLRTRSAARRPCRRMATRARRRRSRSQRRPTT